MRPGEIKQVLRYWLGAVRLESALGARPKARAPDPRRPPPNLLEPGFGQDYFRVSAEFASFFLGGTATVDVPIESAFGFFERWLRRAYWEQSSRRRGLAPPREEVHLASFPSLLFKRRGELGGLFRFPVEIEPRRAGKAWPVPIAEHRAQAELPDVLRVHDLSEAPGPDVLPLSIDLQLLSRTLGVLPEDLDDLTERWRATSPSAVRMVSDVVRLLDGEVPEPTDPPGLFAALVRAIQPRLPEGVAVYPIGIVHIAAVHATHHLERELRALLELADTDPELAPKRPLHTYITGTPAPSGRAELLGRVRRQGLTERQLEAAEHVLGSTFAAVEGPPGTGKTELIANLAAHAVVERAEAVFEDGRPDTGQLVVTSTNNRAVDNVIEVLSRSLAPGRLPLALRTGSQDVTETVTLAGLTAAIDWLGQADTTKARARLDAATERYRGARAALEAETGGRRRAEARAEKIAALTAELAAMEDEGAIPEVVPAADTLSALAAELLALLGVAEGEGRGRKKVLERRVARLEERFFEPLVASAPELVLALRMKLPPETDALNGEALFLSYAEALGDALELVEKATAPLERARKAQANARRRAELQRTLAELEAEHAADVVAPVDSARREALAFELYEAALEVRERWAVTQQKELLAALEAAAEVARTDRSLRRFLSDRPKLRRSIESLFPVVGCTLLSLGNVFPAEADVIDRLVIDEAGQCHPAFAVSGLLRASRALVIGDVHQLEPVIDLGMAEEAAVYRNAKVEMPKARFEVFRVHERARNSAQHLANRAVVTRPRLVDHFRCQPEIIALSDALTGYGLEVWTPRRSLSDRVPSLAGPVEIIAVDGLQRPHRGSWVNDFEAQSLLDRLALIGAEGAAWSEIAVLTPYVGQLELLREGLRRRRIPFDLGEEAEAQGVATGTVHRFQGGERTVVLLSTVVTTPRSLRFLDEHPNLLNVAISRARDHLIVFGHDRTLRSGRFTRVIAPR